MSDQQAINDISSNTVAVHGRKMDANSLLNIPSLARSHGIKALRDRFLGCRAVVCGAGPSLDTAIPALQAHQGKYLLVCADRALKPLLAAGLTPHIVCCADMDVVLKSLFQGYPIPDSVALCYDPDSYHEVPMWWKGPLIAYDHYFDVGIWSRTFFGEHGVLGKNFTVSHTALYVAATLGCSQVILAGVDFAYPSESQHHAAGTVDVEAESKEKAAAHWVNVPGNKLPEVHTTEVFATCLPSMANEIEELQIKVFNPSPLGAAIRGAEPIEWDAAFALPARDCDATEHLAEVFAKDEPYFDKVAFDMQSAHVIQLMDRMVWKATEGIDELKRTHKIDGLRNKLLFLKWQKAYMRVLKIRDEVMENEYAHYLLSRSMHGYLTQTRKMGEATKDLPMHSPKKLATDCSRLALLFHGLGENAKLFVRCLCAVREQFGMSVVLEPAYRVVSDA